MVAQNRSVSVFRLDLYEVQDLISRPLVTGEMKCSVLGILFDAFYSLDDFIKSLDDGFS